MKRIHILTSPDYIVFVDRLDESRILAFSKDELKRKKELTFRFDREINIPDSYTIPVYELEMVNKIDEENFEYDIVKKEKIEIPINRIKWRFIESGKS